MGKYILREIRTALRKKMTIVIAVVIVAACILSNLAVMAFTLIYGSNIDGVRAYNVLEFGTWVFWIPYLVTIFMAHSVFGSECPDPHIKDNITKNLSRTGIYIGKLLAAMVEAVFYMIIAVVAFLGATRMFHSDMKLRNVKDFLQKTLLAVPLWVAGVSIGMMFLFIFKEKLKAYIGFYILTFVIPMIVTWLSEDKLSLPFARTVRTLLVKQSFSHIPSTADPARNVTFIVCQGLLYAVIAAVIGIIAYRKRDFKKD